MFDFLRSLKEDFGRKRKEILAGLLRIVACLAEFLFTGLWTHKCLKNFSFLCWTLRKNASSSFPHQPMCFFFYSRLIAKRFSFHLFCLYFPIHAIQRRVIWLKRFTHSFCKCEHEHRKGKEQRKGSSSSSAFNIWISSDSSFRTKPTWNI